MRIGGTRFFDVCAPNEKPSAAAYIGLGWGRIEAGVLDSTDCVNSCGAKGGVARVNALADVNAVGRGRLSP